MKDQFDGFDIISTYTEEQGIEDGMFVQPFPDKFPGALFTSAVHEAIEALDNGQTYEQRAIPLLMDAVTIVNSDRREHLFTTQLEGNVTGQTLWIGRNGMNGFTIMLPSDY